jgi:hypothetical protein
MVQLNACWTPCFWHGNVRDGSVAVAIYTFFMSLAVVTYCAYIMTGGDTSQLWLPFFETDLNSTLQGSFHCNHFFIYPPVIGPWCKLHNEIFDLLSLL